MVKITMDIIKKLCDQINAYLRIKSRTSYLKMTYKEVLFPVCFTGKKKYFRIGYEDKVNFRPDDLFKKGIDTSLGLSEKRLYGRLWVSITHVQFKKLLKMFSEMLDLGNRILTSLLQCPNGRLKEVSHAIKSL